MSSSRRALVVVRARARLRRIIELQLGLLEGERDLAEVITVILRQSTKLMKEYAAPRFTAYLDSLASVVLEGQEAGDFRADVHHYRLGRKHLRRVEVVAVYRGAAGERLNRYRADG